MKIYGLTGNIGTGKSTAAAIFRELGAYIIDADQIARKIVEPGGEAIRELENEFGSEIVNSDDSLNRKKLSEIVFNDNKKLKKLNKITHPKILDEIRNQIFVSMEKGYKVTIIEAALIGNEGRLRNLLNGLIVITSDEENQIKRVKERDNLSSEEIRARIKSQKKLDEVKKFADYIIKNDGGLDHLRTEITSLWDKISN